MTAETRHTPKFVWRNDREGLRVSHQMIDIKQPWRHGRPFNARRTFRVYSGYGIGDIAQFVEKNVGGYCRA